MTLIRFIINLLMISIGIISIIAGFVVGSIKQSFMYGYNKALLFDQWLCK